MLTGPCRVSRRVVGLRSAKTMSAITVIGSEHTSLVCVVAVGFGVQNTHVGTIFAEQSSVYLFTWTSKMPWSISIGFLHVKRSNSTVWT